MSSIKERKIALNIVLQQKLNQVRQIERQRNEITTEIIQIQGKLDLLNELEKEEIKEVKKEEPKKTKVEVIK